MTKQIKYKHLGIWLKIAVVTGWIALAYWIIAFFVGFFTELYN